MPDYLPSVPELWRWTAEMMRLIRLTDHYDITGVNYTERAISNEREIRIMGDITLGEILHLAEQLTPEEQKALIDNLEAEVRQLEAGRTVLTQEDFNRTFGFLIFDAGLWPMGLTLRREDTYGDAER